MLFHTTPFLIFFAIVFPVYWAIRQHRFRMLWLLLASCVFYMSWNPWLILLILLSASVDYVAARAMERVNTQRSKKLLMIGSITFNLLLLGFFKYCNFFLDNAFQVLSWFNVEAHRPALEIILPLGISFYTFETISYIVDVYQGKIKAVQNPLDYALYIMFFPHLIAGPIVRPKDFLPQVQRPKRWDHERFYLGCRMFLSGFFKKAILADQLAPFVDAVFQSPGEYSSSSVWLAVLGYTMQIYLDFSGYSDMGIGLAHMFGFKLGINFNYPYFADSATDFWRRWHISLSTWLRDYLYVPLGGNRGSTWFTYRNLILVMLLGGLWHGASWTFVAWGLYHGILLVLHRAIPWPRWTKQPSLQIVWVLGTFLLVCIGWVFFRAQTFVDAGVILQHLLVPISGRILEPVAVASILLCMLAVFIEHGLFDTLRMVRWERRLSAPLMGAALAGILMLACVFFPGSNKAFIYFQF